MSGSSIYVIWFDLNNGLILYKRSICRKTLVPTHQIKSINVSLQRTPTSTLPSWWPTTCCRLAESADFSKSKTRIGHHNRPRGARNKMMMMMPLENDVQTVITLSPHSLIFFSPPRRRRLPIWTTIMLEASSCQMLSRHNELMMQTAAYYP